MLREREEGRQAGSGRTREPCLNPTLATLHLSRMVELPATKTIDGLICDLAQQQHERSYGADRGGRSGYINWLYLGD